MKKRLAPHYTFRVVYGLIGFSMRHAFARVYVENFRRSMLSEALQPTHDELACTPALFPDVHLLPIRFALR